MSPRWPQLGFSDLFENVTSSIRKLPRGEYLASGRFPVVDQGEDFIGGWSADESLVHPGPIPVVVYGDHTRAVKLLERPFIQGADGVKVLAPSPSVSARFAAWMLRAFPVPSKGYARHYADLRKMVFPVPRLPEQHRIVAAIETQFSRLDAAVAALTRAKANVKRARASVLKAAVEGRLVPTEAALARAEGRAYEPASVLLERILAERQAAWAASGARGKYQEPVKPDTAGLPELPEGWGWASIDQVTTLITSGSRGWAEHYADAGPIFIRSQDINTFRLQLSGVAHVSLPQGAEGTRTRVMAGDVLVIITGANVTVCARVSHDIGEAYVSQHVGLCRPVATATSAYAHLWLRAEGGGRTQLQAAAYGAGKPGLNLPNIRNVVVGLPPSHEQLRIVAEVDRRLSVLDALDRSIDLNLARCARLRQAVLNRAFEGRLVPAESRDAR